jgi:hypothetical protein
MKFRFVTSDIKLLGNDYNFLKFLIKSKICGPEVSISTELSLEYNKLIYILKAHANVYHFQ